MQEGDISLSGNLGEELAKTGVREGIRLIPSLIDNQKTIREYIKNAARTFKSKKLGSLDISIYMTWFADFKAEYSLEELNQYICLFLSQYGANETSRDRIKYKDMVFSIAYEFTYSDRLYAIDEFLDYDGEQEEIIIPGIKGVSLFLFPEEKDIKIRLSNGYELIEKIEKNLLEKFDFKVSGRFLYIQTDSFESRAKVMTALKEEMKQWNDVFKNLSAKENEIKLKLNIPLGQAITNIF